MSSSGGTATITSSPTIDNPIPSRAVTAMIRPDSIARTSSPQSSSSSLKKRRPFLTLLPASPLRRFDSLNALKSIPRLHLPFLHHLRHPTAESHDQLR